MTRFERNQSSAAVALALTGGQALHVYENLGFKSAPVCFKRSKLWAHLYDQDVERLKRTVRYCGVRVIVIHYEGTKQQHVDLCGKPLDKALALVYAQPELSL